MKITIITVCYNSAATIEKTIASVASQVYENIEYIILDRISEDATLEIVKKNSRTITKFISETDKGMYDAMNKGIAMATGDLIGILNSDDIFNDEYVLKNVAKFHNENDIDASVGNIVQFNKSGKIVRKYSAIKWKPNKLKIGFMPPHPGLFLNKSLFDKLGNYQLDFTIGADYELITRFFLKHKITWKYSGITTTKMLIGGLSSSGVSSYFLISKEIKKALSRNEIPFSSFKINVRGIWKLIGFLKKR